MTGFIFIHGAGLNGRIWDEVAVGLDNPCLQVDFPHRTGSEESRRQLTLQDYTDAVKQQVKSWNVEKFIIVAHSLGGIPAIQLAHDMPDRLAGFAALGAAIPRNGGSFLSAMPAAKRIFLGTVMRIFGTRPPESAIRQGLCNDLTPEQAAEIVRSFVPESIRLYRDRVQAGIPEVPKMYMKLEKDNEFTPDFQDRMISNLSPHEVVNLETGHLPMLGRPDEVARALQRLLSRCE